jgi:glycine cleavage system H protein
MINGLLMATKCHSLQNNDHGERHQDCGRFYSKKKIDFSQQTYPLFAEKILDMTPLEVNNYSSVMNKLLIFAINKNIAMTLPDNLRYTKDHEWIHLEGNIATIGITDFAQSELGDIVYVEIESVGKTLEAEAIFGTIEAVKTVSDLYLPVTGTVNEVNPKLAGSPELINTDPYGEGWMIKMTVSDLSSVEKLLNASAYQSIVG